MKLLILSDSATALSGFGGITRDLATRIATHMSDKIDVATCGYGVPPSRGLPFFQYHIGDPVKNGWEVRELPEIYTDFCPNGEQCVIMTIWDASRLLWFADPQYCTEPMLRKFLEQAPIKRVGYWPIDSEGFYGLSETLAHVIKKYDISLAYSDFGAGVIKRSLPACDDMPGSKIHMVKPKVPEYIPHGIDTSIFYPRPVRKSLEKIEAIFGHSLKDILLIGCVATNQDRKDFATLFKILRAFLDSGREARVWLHTDAIVRNWDLHAIMADLKLQGKFAVTLGLTNDELAEYYSACDVTIGPGLGEGFGFPIFEAIACGTPCFHVNYGGAPEFFVNKEHLINPVAYRHEKVYNSCRPVLNHLDFVDAIEKHGNIKPILNPRLDWNNLWWEWENFFLHVVSVFS